MNVKPKSLSLRAAWESLGVDMQNCVRTHLSVRALCAMSAVCRGWRYRGGSFEDRVWARCVAMQLCCADGLCEAGRCVMTFISPEWWEAILREQKILLQVPSRWGDGRREDPEEYQRSLTRLLRGLLPCLVPSHLYPKALQTPSNPLEIELMDSPSNSSPIGNAAPFHLRRRELGVPQYEAQLSDPDSGCFQSHSALQQPPEIETDWPQMNEVITLGMIRSSPHLPLLQLQADLEEPANTRSRWLQARSLVVSLALLIFQMLMVGTVAIWRGQVWLYRSLWRSRAEVRADLSDFTSSCIAWAADPLQKLLDIFHAWTRMDANFYSPQDVWELHRPADAQELRNGADPDIQHRSLVRRVAPSLRRLDTVTEWRDFMRELFVLRTACERAGESLIAEYLYAKRSLLCQGLLKGYILWAIYGIVAFGGLLGVVMCVLLLFVQHVQCMCIRAPSLCWWPLTTFTSPDVATVELLVFNTTEKLKESAFSSNGTSFFSHNFEILSFAHSLLEQTAPQLTDDSPWYPSCVSTHHMVLMGFHAPLFVEAGFLWGSLMALFMALFTFSLLGLWGVWTWTKNSRCGGRLNRRSMRVIEAGEQRVHRCWRAIYGCWIYRCWDRFLDRCEGAWHRAASYVEACTRWLR